MRQYPFVPDDSTRMWKFLRDNGLERRWCALRRAYPGRLFLFALADWLAIALAFAVVLACGLIAAPLAVLVIGNRQRALGNLLHDAAHANYRLPRRFGDALADVCLFLPMWNAKTKYRRDHFAHHRHLGDPAADVDFIHREADRGGSLLAVWRRLTFDPHTLASSVFAHLWLARPAETMAMLAFSMAALGLMSAGLGLQAAAEFALLWLAARALVFHPITMFREISDHVGLRPGSVMGFSRNHVGRGPLSQLFHPHNNGFHLLHHLDPALPFFALPEAHEMLMRWPAYAAATHTSRYFGGDQALVRSWVGASTASASSA